jgi:glycine/D-amino acid oxidase-like deaminating enzyme
MVGRIVVIGGGIAGVSTVAALRSGGFDTQLSKSTAHRVLGLLERNGVVERVGTSYQRWIASSTWSGERPRRRIGTPSRRRMLLTVRRSTPNRSPSSYTVEPD